MKRFLLFTLLAACAPAVERSELAQPYFYADSESGLCGAQVALDAHGEVWTEHGCENGSQKLTHAGYASGEAIARVRAAFHVLPAAQEQCQTTASEAGTLIATEHQEWRACVGEDGSPVAPYAEAAQSLFALVR